MHVDWEGGPGRAPRGPLWRCGQNHENRRVEIHNIGAPTLNGRDISVGTYQPREPQPLCLTDLAATRGIDTQGLWGPGEGRVWSWTGGISICRVHRQAGGVRWGLVGLESAFTAHGVAEPPELRCAPLQRHHRPPLLGRSTSGAELTIDRTLSDGCCRRAARSDLRDAPLGSGERVWEPPC